MKRQGKQQKSDRLVGVNERGRRIGQYHPRARLTDNDVKLIIELYEEYPRHHPRHVTCTWLAEKFGVHEQTIKKIVHGDRRAQTPSRYKRS